MSETLQTPLHNSRWRAARRAGAEARARLTARRAWFADPPEPPQDGGDSGAGEPPALPDPPARPDGAPDWIGDPDKAWKEISRLRAENAKKRVESKPKADEPSTASDRIAALEAKAAAAERRALVAEIATEFGLPKALAARLQGDDEEALRADAEVLKAYVPTPKEAEGKDDKPKPSGRQTQTTTVPKGGAAQETDQQRSARLFGGGATVFQKGGGVVYNGSQTDLDNPVG